MVKVPVTAPSALALLMLSKPANRLTPPVKELVPERVMDEVALFCVTLITPLPIGPERVVAPVPVPEFVIVPMLFTEPESVIPPAAMLLNVRFEVPEIVPVSVRSLAPLLVTVMAGAPKVMGPAPKVRIWVPPKLKLPFQTWGLALVRVRVVLVSSNVVPAPMVKVPVAAPKALALLILSTPASKFTPPVKELVPERVREEVALFCVTLVTLLPIGPEIVVAPVPVPEFVMVPMLFTEPESAIPPAAMLLNVRFEVPERVPVSVRRLAPLLVTVRAGAPKIMGLAAKVRAWVPPKLKLPFQAWGLALARVSAPNVLSKVAPPAMVKVPVAAPRAFALLMLSCPAKRFTPPVKRLVPERVKGEVALFCTTLVTLLPITAEMMTEPVPVPKLMTWPVLAKFLVVSVIPAAVLLLFCRTRVPVPLTPPLSVKAWVPLLLPRVVPPLLTVSVPVTFITEVVLFSVMAVTFGPTVPDRVVAPVPVPELVRVPALLTVPDNVSPPAAVLLKVRLEVPVMVPVSVRSLEPRFVTVMALAPKVIRPTANVRAWVPPKLKLPFQAWGFALVSVKVALVSSKVVPAPMVKVPVAAPSAVALLILS